MDTHDMTSADAREILMPRPRDHAARWTQAAREPRARGKCAHRLPVTYGLPHAKSAINRRPPPCTDKAARAHAAVLLAAASARPAAHLRRRRGLRPSPPRAILPSGGRPSSHDETPKTLTQFSQHKSNAYGCASKRREKRSQVSSDG